MTAAAPRSSLGGGSRNVSGLRAPALPAQPPDRSPRTAGPQPRDVLRLGLPDARLGRRVPSPATSCGSVFRIARLGRRVPSPATSCGSHLRIARLGRRVPSPPTACGSHYDPGGGLGRGAKPPSERPSALLHPCLP